MPSVPYRLGASPAKFQSGKAAKIGAATAFFRFSPKVFIIPCEEYIEEWAYSSENYVLPAHSIFTSNSVVR